MTGIVGAAEKEQTWIFTRIETDTTKPGGDDVRSDR